MPIIEKKFDLTSYLAKYLVEAEHDSMRIDQYVQLYLKSFSRELVKEKIANKKILIQGRSAQIKSSTKVKKGDIITLIIDKTAHEDEYWLGQKISLEAEPKVIFQDDSLLIVAKPPFMSTHPTGRHLFYCATSFFEAQGYKTIHSVHRLDRETSGVLVLAKNPPAANKLTVAFEQSKVKKCYFFIAKLQNATKWPIPHKFTANERLSAEEEGLKRVYITHYPVDSVSGKEALTHFHLFYQEKNYVLALAFPQTGRQHQIRVHAFAHHLPLLGDKLYLGNYEMFQRFKDNLSTESDHQLMEIPRQALHAIALKIPYEGNDHIFLAELPMDLKNWIQENLSIPVETVLKQSQKLIENYFNNSVR